jgi:hypothetical protein
VSTSAVPGHLWQQGQRLDVVRPVSRESLAELLDRMGVPGDAYHLFGVHLNDAAVIDHRPDGWVVFYSERGAGRFTASGFVSASCSAPSLLAGAESPGSRRRIKGREAIACDGPGQARLLGGVTVVEAPGRVARRERRSRSGRSRNSPGRTVVSGPCGLDSAGIAATVRAQRW